MKTLPILSIAAGLALPGGLATCELKKEQAAPYEVDVAKGQRIKLKGQKDAVTEFENLLLKIPEADRTGTWVNLRRDDGREEEGPTADGRFVPPSAPIGPNGSMHNTQSIRLQQGSDFKSVVDSFDTGTPTPAP